MTDTEKERERFMKHVWPEPMSGCWLWDGCLNSGYGRFHSRLSHQEKAHRFSWRMHRGEIPEGLCVLHRWDNRACVNPDHLFLGTKGDNNRDRNRKRRDAWGRRHGNAKLTDDAVREIRALHAAGGENHASIGARFGVRKQTVAKVLSGERWAHV